VAGQARGIRGEERASVWSGSGQQGAIGPARKPSISGRAGRAGGIAVSMRAQHADATGVGPTQPGRPGSAAPTSSTQPGRLRPESAATPTGRRAGRASSVLACALSQDGLRAGAWIGAGRQKAGPRGVATRCEDASGAIRIDLGGTIFRTVRTRADHNTPYMVGRPFGPSSSVATYG
jgi:hypothetical protein